MNVGIYKAKVVQHWYGKTATKKTQFIGIKWQVGEETIDSESYITTNTARMTRRVCKILGFDIDAPDADLELLNREPFKFVGAEAELDVQEESYGDVVTIKVKWINELRAAPSTDEAKSALAMLRAAGSAKSKAKAAARVSEPRKAPIPAESEEDIPF